MKQYVLEEPVAVPAPPRDTEAPTLRHPGRWRWVLLAVLLEPVALAVLYVGLSGGSSWSQAAPSTAAPSTPVAYVAAFSMPRQAESAAALAAAPAEPRVSGVTQERGRYVIELQDTAPDAALSLLAQATQARVAGAGIFIGSPVRLTRSAVAASPREAWQAVFGDVANFAIACAGKACDVRFVSLVKAGVPVPAPDSLQGAFPQMEAAAGPAVAPPVQARVDQANAAAAAAAAALAMQGGDAAAADN